MFPAYPLLEVFSGCRGHSREQHTSERVSISGWFFPSVPPLSSSSKVARPFALSTSTSSASATGLTHEAHWSRGENTFLEKRGLLVRSALCSHVPVLIRSASNLRKACDVYHRRIRRFEFLEAYRGVPQNGRRDRRRHRHSPRPPWETTTAAAAAARTIAMLSTNI